jgi:hypothetical protein
MIEGAILICKMQNTQKYLHTIIDLLKEEIDQKLKIIFVNKKTERL